MLLTALTILEQNVLNVNSIRRIHALYHSISRLGLGGRLHVGKFAPPSVYRDASFVATLSCGGYLGCV